MTRSPERMGRKNLKREETEASSEVIEEDQEEIEVEIQY